MNIKTAFGYVGDVIGGLTGVLGGLVAVGVLSQVVFGTGWLGIDVIGNISGIVGGFRRRLDWISHTCYFIIIMG